MVKVVILDLDGTLMDTNYLHVEAWARALREVGATVPRSIVHRQIGKGTDQLLPALLPDEAAHERAEALHGKYYEELAEYGYPLPGAKELVARLAEQGYVLWVATSAQPEELERHLQALETEGRLAGVVAASDVERSKPAPDIFRATVEQAGCSPEEAVVLGDSLWDIEAARASGVRAVMVLTGGGYAQAELEAAGAVAVYADCAAALAAGFPGAL